MSDKQVIMHTLTCDWPGCPAVACTEDYSAFGGYDDAVDEMCTISAVNLHGQIKLTHYDCDGGGWLHLDNNLDYCPMHWDIEDNDNIHICNTLEIDNDTKKI